MKMIVCVKQVVDPEEPPASFGVDTAARKISLPAGVPNVISPFDRHAAEAALRIKDLHGGSVVALSLGDNPEPAVLRDSLAMGADELVLVEDPASADGDAWTTAHGLAMAVRKIGDCDLILTGRQDSETDAGTVGTCLAKILGVPCVTVARKVEVRDGRALVERVTDEGHEVIEVELPAVVTVSNELGTPRYPTVKQTMRARKIKPRRWTREELSRGWGQVEDGEPRARLVRLLKPERDVHCEMIRGATPEEMGANLAVELREAGLV